MSLGTGQYWTNHVPLGENLLLPETCSFMSASVEMRVPGRAAHTPLSRERASPFSFMLFFDSALYGLVFWTLIPQPVMLFGAVLEPRNDPPVGLRKLGPD